MPLLKGWSWITYCFSIFFPRRSRACSSENRRTSVTTSPLVVSMILLAASILTLNVGTIEVCRGFVSPRILLPSRLEVSRLFQRRLFGESSMPFSEILQQRQAIRECSFGDRRQILRWIQFLRSAKPFAE